jgi:hypothetical protein
LKTSKNIKVVDNTQILPSVQIDDTHGIDYYYPYFYKTHLLEYNDNYNFNELSNICHDIGCEFCCDNGLTCKRCKHGFFLYQGKCYTVCPKNYVADIFKRICSPFIINSKMLN